MDSSRHPTPNSTLTPDDDLAGVAQVTAGSAEQGQPGVARLGVGDAVTQARDATASIVSRSWTSQPGADRSKGCSRTAKWLREETRPNATTFATVVPTSSLMVAWAGAWPVS